MAALHIPMRPLTRLKPLLRQTREWKLQKRCISVQQLPGFEREEMAPFRKTFRSDTHTKSIKVHAPPPSPIKKCPDPISLLTASQTTALDPTGARTRLFSRTNPEAAKVGDILLVRTRSGDPFAGVCINIRRRGIDTAILLRGQLTRVGVEMWYKIYSPLVEAIEVVERARKRARRARLTYMRNVKHDRGNVENVVRVYLRQKAALGSGAVGGAKAEKKDGAKLFEPRKKVRKVNKKKQQMKK